MNVKTVIEVKHNNGTTENVSVVGAGQAAISAVLSKYKKCVCILKGFIINDKFQPADLESYWN